MAPGLHLPSACAAGLILEFCQYVSIKGHPYPAIEHGIGKITVCHHNVLANHLAIDGENWPKALCYKASKRAAGLMNPDGVAAKMKISNNEAMVTPKST